MRAVTSVCFMRASPMRRSSGGVARSIRSRRVWRKDSNMPGSAQAGAFRHHAGVPGRRRLGYRSESCPRNLFSPMSQPAIALTATTEVLRDVLRTRLNAAYSRAARAAGLRPFILPVLAAADADAMLEGMDGLILTGGEDIAPA